MAVCIQTDPETASNSREEVLCVVAHPAFKALTNHMLKIIDYPDRPQHPELYLDLSPSSTKANPEPQPHETGRKPASKDHEAPGVLQKKKTHPAKRPGPR